MQPIAAAISIVLLVIYARGMFRCIRIQSVSVCLCVGCLVGIKRLHENANGRRCTDGSGGFWVRRICIKSLLGEQCARICLSLPLLYPYSMPIFSAICHNTQ